MGGVNFFFSVAAECMWHGRVIFLWGEGDGVGRMLDGIGKRLDLPCV